MNMTNIDQITMRLVHYFVTKENYSPILVNLVSTPKDFSTYILDDNKERFKEVLNHICKNHYKY